MDAFAKRFFTYRFQDSCVTKINMLEFSMPIESSAWNPCHVGSYLDSFHLFRKFALAFESKQRLVLGPFG
jgi:hypothetical protein